MNPPEPTVIKVEMPAKNKKKKKKDRLSRDVLNIIRTTMRNNIELTHIADNKANVLLSLNALMLTFLVPLAIPYFDFINAHYLGIPIAILVVTCLVTIYLAVLVLKPADFASNKHTIGQGGMASPFFFGNYYKLSHKEFKEYLKEALSHELLVRNHLTEDLHYIGSRLGRKMELIQLAFTIFLSGLIVSSIVAFFLFVSIT